jgi:hypothetical protein
MVHRVLPGRDWKVACCMPKRTNLELRVPDSSSIGLSSGRNRTQLAEAVRGWRCHPLVRFSISTEVHERHDKSASH